MTSKTFVHTHAAVVVQNVLIAAFDLRRRDVDADTAFSYFAKKQRAYKAIVASSDALDATFVHVSDDSSESESAHTFTRLQVFDADTCCERCAAKRGAAHESYCDVSKQASESSESSEKKASSALSLFEKLKMSAAQASNVKNESAASESDDESDDESESESESESAKPKSSKRK